MPDRHRIRTAIMGTAETASAVAAAGITVAETEEARAAGRTSAEETAVITGTGMHAHRITGTDRGIITAGDRMATAVEETAAMAASGYLDALKRPRMVLTESSRSRKTPVREIKRKMTAIRQADTVRAPRKR